MSGELHLAVYGEAEFSALGIRPEGTDGDVRVVLQPPKYRDLSPYTVPVGDLDRHVVVVQHPSRVRPRSSPRSLAAALAAEGQDVCRAKS